MSSKRYVIFANPPTIQELRELPISSPEDLVWDTTRVYHPEGTSPSGPGPTNDVNGEQEAEESLGYTTLSDHVIRIPSSGINLSADSYFQDLFKSFNGPENSSIRPEKRVRFNDQPGNENTEKVNRSFNDSVDLEQIMDSVSMDYFQSQLDYHESFAENSTDVTLMGSPGDRTNCLLSCSQSHPYSLTSSKSSTNELSAQSQTQQTSYSESIVVNPPQWHFDARSCTPLDQIGYSPGRLYSILFHLSQKTPLMTIELKKIQKNGSSTANLAHFECMDDSGSSIKLALWNEVAETLDSACLVGDIVYLSGIAISSYQGKIQASSTHGARAQICYRLRPTHQSHLKMFCPDMRLGYDPTTRRVQELVEWAKRVFF